MSVSVNTIDAPTLFSHLELEDSSKYVLTGHYRCDRCGAQAYVRATLHNELELFFCVHHGRRHYESIKTHLKEWYTEEVRLHSENRLVGSEN